MFSECCMSVLFLCIHQKQNVCVVEKIHNILHFCFLHTQLLVDVNNAMLLIYNLLSCFLEIGILVV